MGRYWIQVWIYGDNHNIDKNNIKNEDLLRNFFRAAILLSCGKKFHPSKVPKKYHQNLMCDSSKEPHRLTDYKSEEKMKEIDI